MTKLNETKVEDMILRYKYFKRINQQYRGKLFNNVINSLAKAFKLSASTIGPVVESKYEGPKSKRKSRKIIDDFDKEAIRHVIHGFYGDNILPTAKMIKQKLKERNIDIGINFLKRYVACRNTTFKMKDVRRLDDESIQTITADAWRKCTEHVIAIENRLCAAEGIIDRIEPVLLSLSSDESCDDIDDYESSDTSE